MVDAMRASSISNNRIWLPRALRKSCSSAGITGCYHNFQLTPFKLPIPIDVDQCDPGGNVVS